MEVTYKKVGLFGGTFDPIHNGHIEAALFAQKKYNLDHIYFIPTYISPHKVHNAPQQSCECRKDMVSRAIEGHSKFSLSEFEINRTETSYSMDTIAHYKMILPKGCELYFILGLDAFLDISTWKNVDRICGNCHLLVVGRTGFRMKSFKEVFSLPKLQMEISEIKPYKEYRHISGNHIYVEDGFSIDVSATHIRKLIEQRKSVKSFVPERVWSYIHEQRLYEKN